MMVVRGISNGVVFSFKIDNETTECHTITAFSGSSSVDLYRNNYSSSGFADLEVSVWHHVGTNNNPFGGNNCDYGYPTYTWRGTIELPKYNPYSPPSLSMNSITTIRKMWCIYNDW